MTTIFNRVAAGQPQTHAILIGVGAYRHLRGGSGPKLDNDMGLRQLSSPPISATSVADFLLGESGVEGVPAPLGSVELLLSPSQPYTPGRGGVSIQVEAATKQNITTAFDRWYARCDTREDNVAIFYFCGHGLEKEFLALLAEDFGENPNRRFENAINLEATWRGMASCRARIQCYFPDTCRQAKSDTFANLSFKDAKVLTDTDLRDQRPKDAPIIYATGFGERAFGFTNRLTRYTEALLLSLGGMAGRRKSGKWVITTVSLGDAMLAAVERLNRRGDAPPQSCKLSGEPSGGIIRMLPGRPIISATVSCDPPEASALADFLLIPQRDLLAPQDRRWSWRRAPQAGNWELELPADSYQLSATFPGGRYAKRDDMLWVLPPDDAEAMLEVAP